MGARAGHFAGASVGAQAPSLARRVTTSSLDPRRTPASRDRRPSASKGLKHKGPGWEQPVYVAENTETPPSRTHHGEDPPVLPSVKGSPFTDGRTGGRPPGDGFCPSRGWLVSGPDSGAAHAQEGPQPQAALRATGPTLGKARPVNRVPGVLSGEREALRATQKTASFPVEHTSRQLSHPRKAECPEKTGAPGAGAGGRQGFAPGGASPIERNPRPPTGSAGGLRPEPCLGS